MLALGGHAQQGAPVVSNESLKQDLAMFSARFTKCENDAMLAVGGHA